jgi:RNA polymerase sigma factor (sigma-70 family)
MKNFGRAIAAEKHRRRRYRTGREQWFFEAAVDTRSDEKACLASAEQTRACADQLLRLLMFLDPREQHIIRMRTGLNGNTNGVSLENIGKQIGVSKERVRQLHARALKKLRNLAAATHVELP